MKFGAYSTPQNDEIEVSLFGPGYGECVVVHLGDGSWIVVDSCINPATKRPVALDYFDQLGVNVHAQVEAVFPTHWHDDHIRGLSTIVAEAVSAKVCLSVAMTTDEFAGFAFACAKRDSDVRVKSGVSEMFNTLEHLGEGNRIAKKCIANRRVLQIPQAFGLECWALSPGDEEVASFF